MYAYQYIGDGPILTLSGLLIARRHNRIVIGGRGAYVEFLQEDFVRQSVHIPKGQSWRLQHPFAYYVEYRTNDSTNAKVYLQKRVVEYADYVVGRLYTTPLNLQHFQRTGLIPDIARRDVK